MVPTFAYLGLVYLVVRSPRQSLHGKARFASVRDVARRGLFRHDPGALVVGRMGRRLVRLGGQWVWLRVNRPLVHVLSGLFVLGTLVFAVPALG